jgi:AcrR family transcriptional regulator
MGLRELHKRRRRDAILRAARELLRESGGSAISRKRIAARAEVAPATVYNLVGTQARLWSALAEDFMDELQRRLEKRSTADPVARIRSAVADTVALLVRDPQVSRRMIGGWVESGHLLRRAPITQILAALEKAKEAGILERNVDERLLASSISTACVGAAHLWAAGVITGDVFRSRVLLAADVALAASATVGHRARLLGVLRGRRRPRARAD